MKNFRLFSAIIVLQITVVVAQNLGSHGKNEFTRSKRLATANNNTCSTHQLKLIFGAILKTPQEEKKSSVASGEEVEFVCKNGYHQVGQLKSFVCQEDGNWKETSPKQFGFCAKKVSWSTIDVTGQATGTLTSAAIEQHPSDAPVYYTWKLVTRDPGFYIKLLFVKFSMSPDCTQNFIALENVNFTDLGRTKKCCNDHADEGVCKFAGKSSPPLSRSVSHSMTVKFYSNNTDKSHFKAIWYNVNGLFPNGLIPRQDPTYGSQIKVVQKLKAKRAPADSPSILALIIFALIVFAIGAFVACKLGKRYLGPSCSFGHFWVWASSIWTSRAPSTPRRRQEAPQEERGLMTDTDSPFTGARVQIRPADRRRPGDESENSSLDSSLMTA